VTRLEDLGGPHSYLDLPEVDQAEVRVLWHSDFWDVPLNGLATYQGRKCWFQTLEDLRHNDPAEVIYLLIELSDKQITEEEYWHNLFREQVGAHTDYDEHGHRKTGSLMPESAQKQYFDARKSREGQDFADNRVIGWFKG
jgi:hypothetical protein